MAQMIPPPDSQSLLPPLLACLPTSFASSKPPPVLLKLLSPILRQRLNIFTSSGSNHDSWLRLLCWDQAKAETLKETIENASFEPHPSSGELEVGDIERISYKRFDQETLKVQLPLTDWSLTAVYLWCTGSEEGDAWRLAELLPYDSGMSQDPTWSPTPAIANERAQVNSTQPSQPQTLGGNTNLAVPGQDEDDDDAYWAQYGQTPNAGTPARNGSIVNGASAVSEADYYASYGNVQPAMDGYDPDEDHSEIKSGPSVQEFEPLQAVHNVAVAGESGPSMADNDPPQPASMARLNMPDRNEATQISHPVPSSPSSRSGSDAIARLESAAGRYSASEIAIKQHISYSVKSMYRLAKGAGMSKHEFEDMIHRELETLSLLDRED